MKQGKLPTPEDIQGSPQGGREFCPGPQPERGPRRPHEGLPEYLIEQSITQLQYVYTHSNCISVSALLYYDLCYVIVNIQFQNTHMHFSASFIDNTGLLLLLGSKCV